MQQHCNVRCCQAAAPTHQAAAGQVAAHTDRPNTALLLLLQPLPGLLLLLRLVLLLLLVVRVVGLLLLLLPLLVRGCCSSLCLERDQGASPKAYG